MNTESYDLERFTKLFMTSLVVLVVIGLIMVYSSSYIFAGERYGNANYFIYKQLAFLLISSLICFVVSKTKIEFWLKYGFFIHCLGVLALGLTFIPGIGVNVKGAHRWLNFGVMGFQPGEIVKITFILLCIPFFERFKLISKNEKIKYVVTILATLALLVLQPDFGTFSICFLVIACVAFLSSFSRKYLFSFFTGGVILIIPILLSQPYRVRRLFAFLDPWKNAKTSGFQVIQSYLAFANGSIFGQGLGNSNEKLFYLPEAHNDFIFSVIGEELGFIGVAFVIVLFLLFLYYGFRISLKIARKESYILVSSLVFTIGLQTALNMGVVLGLLPTKGLNLPFISSGGSSLMANFFAVGLVLAAARKEMRLSAQNYSQSDSFNNFNNGFTPSYGSSSPTQESLTGQSASRESILKPSSRTSGFSAYANRTKKY